MIKNILKYFLILLMFLVMNSCSNPSDQSKEDDDNWINANDIQIYFSPNNNIDLIMIREIQNAKKEISMAIYDITNEKVSDALIIAHNKGIKVRFYTDKNTENEKDIIIKLKENNIEVKIANPQNWSNVESYRAIMHNKFIVIDENTVITGSYNFTTNAEENNRENLLVIPNKIIAKKYYEQFNLYWDNP